MSWSHSRFEEPATALVSTADAKAHLRVVGTADDSYIDALVLAATFYVQQYTGYRCYQQAFIEYIDGFPATREMPLHLYPTTGIEVRYYDADDVQQTMDAADYWDHQYKKPSTVEVKASWPTTAQRLGAVLVLGTAGESTCPPDILHAIKLIVGHWYEYPDETSVSIPAAARALLLQWRIFR